MKANNFRIKRIETSNLKGSTDELNEFLKSCEEETVEVYDVSYGSYESADVTYHAYLVKHDAYSAEEYRQAALKKNKREIGGVIKMNFNSFRIKRFESPVGEIATEQLNEFLEQCEKDQVQVHNVEYKIYEELRTPRHCYFVKHDSYSASEKIEIIHDQLRKRYEELQNDLFKVRT